MPGLRCPSCETNWPNIDSMYAKCPECLVDTTYMYGIVSIPTKEAAQRYYTVRFERYYADRGPRAYDPSVDEHAARTAEAIRLAELEHACAAIPTRDVGPPEERDTS